MFSGIPLLQPEHSQGGSILESGAERRTVIEAHEAKCHFPRPYASIHPTIAPKQITNRSTGLSVTVVRMSMWALAPASQSLSTADWEHTILKKVKSTPEALPAARTNASITGTMMRLMTH